MLLVVAPAAGLFVPGVIAVFTPVFTPELIAVLTPGVIAGAPGVIAGDPGLNAVPLPCGGTAVGLVPCLRAVRGAPGAGAGAPELACAYIVFEFGAVKSVPL